MKENNKSQAVTDHILLAHGSKDPRWRKSFEDLLEKSRKSSPKKKFPSAIWRYADPV
jgi:sirohydrochlorin ferrochelatase